MHRTYERRTKARLSFSGVPHTPVNMADSMEEVGGKKDFRPLFGSRNSPITGILHTVCHVYRSMWPPEKLIALLWCHARTFCALLWNPLVFCCMTEVVMVNLQTWYFGTVVLCLEWNGRIQGLVKGIGITWAALGKKLTQELYYLHKPHSNMAAAN